jgi:GDP-L-fucose synthase
MNKSSKIYIAGHTGLVGSALVRALQKRGYRNLVCKSSRELDLRRQDDTEKFFKKEKPEYVFLAAAIVGGIYANNTYKAKFIYDNLTIASNVIHAAYLTRVKKLFNLGSSCIYPKFAPQPIREEHFMTGALEPTNEPYAVAKIAAIKLCRYYNEQYSTNFISVMPTNLYGPHDHYDLKTSHVLPALLRKFYLARLLQDNAYADIRDNFRTYGNAPQGQATPALLQAHLAALGVYRDKVTIWGSGKPYREFLYVDDLAAACLHLMGKGTSRDIGELINIGTGTDIRIRDLAILIKTAVGFTGRIVFDTTQPDGTPRKLLDISRINKLGWRPTVSLADGIRLSYDWFSQAAVGR